MKVDLKLKYSCNGETISICYEMGEDSGVSHKDKRVEEKVGTTAIVVRTQRTTQLFVIGGTSLSQASMVRE